MFQCVVFCPSNWPHIRFEETFAARRVSTWQAAPNHARFQWQELQLVARQDPQDEVPEPILLLAEPLSPPLLKPQTDITLCTSSDSHFGQLTASSLLKTNFSNFSQHLQHSNSKIGISFLR